MYCPGSYLGVDITIRLELVTCLVTLAQNGEHLLLVFATCTNNAKVCQCFPADHLLHRVSPLYCGWVWVCQILWIPTFGCWKMIGGQKMARSSMRRLTASGFVIVHSSKYYKFVPWNIRLCASCISLVQNPGKENCRLRAAPVTWKGIYYSELV